MTMLSVTNYAKQAAAPQPSTKTYLKTLSEVPAGWHLETVVDASLRLARCREDDAPANRAREALSGRLVELWASQPAEAEAWVARCMERFATELAGKATRQDLLAEALLRHGASERGRYGGSTGTNNLWCFSEAGLLRGEPLPVAEREPWAADCLQHSLTRDRCRQLAECLAAAEAEAQGMEMARKRARLQEVASLERQHLQAELERSQQRLEEESSQRRQLEAELHRSQEQDRRLSSLLDAAEQRASSKAAEFRAAQSESANCKKQCEELATCTAAAETAVAEIQKQLRQSQDEHGKCQQRCEELALRLEATEKEASDTAKTKVDLAQAMSAVAKQVELRRLQEENRGCQECCQQAEAARLVLDQEVKSKAELQFEKALLQERCEQLRQQLAKAETKLGQMQVLWEEKGMYKERVRELERKLAEAKPPHSGVSSVHQSLTHQVPVPSVDAASRGQESDLTGELGYVLVDDGVASSSALSCSSWFSVQPDCFMPDAIFKTRSSGVDFFLMGRDLRKGSQVVAGDDETILEVCEAPVLCQAQEVVHLQAGAATLRVTADHPVQVPAADSAVEDGEGGGSSRYVPAGSLKPGALVMLDSGEPTALTRVVSELADCEVMKLAFKPNLSVAVFSCPPCILSKGANSKPATRRGKMCRRRGQVRAVDESADDGRASMPNTAGTCTEILLRAAA